MIRIIAMFAATSVLGTVWLIVTIARTGGLPVLVSTGLLGAVTLVGWAVTLVAGPIAAIQLWRFRESGRRVGIVLFGSGAAYYVVGYVAFRSPDTAGQQVFLAALMFSLPLGALLLRRTRALVNGRPRDQAAMRASGV